MTEFNTFYDREYNARAQVDDPQVYLDRWVKDSQDTRNSLSCQIGVSYGEANRETIDLFLAEDSDKWLVFIHGGYWRVLDTKSFSFVASPFVQAGFNVALVEYELCPAVTIGTIVEQCRRGIAWLYNHAKDYSAGCKQMLITGHSAGGHLTAMMFTTKWAEYGMSADAIVGGIALSGLYDLDPLRQTAMNADLQLDFESVQAQSPMRLKPQISVPLVVADGALESSEFHRQGKILKGAPGWDAVARDPISLPDIHHFNILDPFMQRDEALWAGIWL